MREILQEKPVSNLPADSYLSIVLCKFNGQFVTWLRNKSDNGFSLGHYHGNDLVTATKDFEKRRI